MSSGAPAAGGEAGRGAPNQPRLAVLRVPRPTPMPLPVVLFWGGAMQVRRPSVSHAAIAARIPALIIVLVLALTAGARRAAPEARDFAVQLGAQVQESPPRIDLTWRPVTDAEWIYVFKKALSDTSWGAPLAVLPGSATSFADDAVQVGEIYEYSFQLNLGTQVDTVQVPDGTAVTFEIRDSWGDGICCHHGLGSYIVTGCGVEYASGGAFGRAETTSFVTGGAASCGEVVVAVTLDVFGEETRWKLTEDATGALLGAGGPYESPRYGHMVAGIRVPPVEERGTVLLVVEESVAPAVAAELQRWKRDLIGEGYRVRCRQVGAGDPVPAVKELIRGECAADPLLETVFLLGHVPVPYSGDIRGAHADHCGAWPADVYYAELDAEWTDYLVDNESASRPENDNVPGDGKFDQTWLPSDADLRIGRVDLSRMPAFALGEAELLRRYLDKDHDFRTGLIQAEPRGLIDDNVGDLGGLAPAAMGWRDFSTMVGSDRISAGDFFPDLETESHLWAYGCGGSSFTVCGGVGSTADFATRTVLATFTSMYGSYFGDWDNENNVLRAPLGAAGCPLTCFWSGRPTWHMQHMALGFPIGESTRLTQNNNTLYRISDGTRVVHIALMGDPTLRLHAVRPVAALEVVEEGAGAHRVSWVGSPDAGEGYHLYRSWTMEGPFERLNQLPLTDTTYVDAAPLPGKNVYMVRAMMLRTTPSGSFYDLSCGLIDSLGVAGAPPPAAALPELGAPSLWAAAGGRILLRLPAEGRMRLAVYDVTGALAREISRGRLAAGSHEIDWDGRGEEGRLLRSGVYFLSLTVGDRTVTRRIALVR